MDGQYLRQVTREKLGEVVPAVLPLFVVGGLLLAVLVPSPGWLLVRFVVGSLLIVAGMAVLFVGLDLGILPMGQFIGAALPARGSVALILGVAFALGFATTVAEPDVLILASQVEKASAASTGEGALAGRTVLYVIALGLALFVSAAMARIVTGTSMRLVLGVAYAAMLLLSLAAPAEFVPLAYDAGSVTTGVLTAPVVIALAVGLSSVLAGRSAVTDGFGLLGFASIGPIFAVLLLGLWR